MNSDPLQIISIDSPNPMHSLFAFIKKALMPDISSNRNPNRFDMILAEFLVNPTTPTKLLDLGCGDGIFLQKILELHPPEFGHLQATVQYIGIDRTDSIYDHIDWNVKHSDRCNSCFPVIEKLNFDLRQDEGLLEAINKRGPYDLIVLANVLHELPPKRGPELIKSVFANLNSNGKLIVIDPEHDWVFSNDAWVSEKEWSFDKFPVDWEMEAVWFSPPTINEIFRSIGYNVTVHKYERSTDLWVAVGSLPTTGSAALSDKSKELLSYHLSKQIGAEQVRISKLRNDLRRSFKSAYHMSWELSVKTLQFFAACASQCRRHEALSELKNE